MNLNLGQNKQYQYLGIALGVLALILLWLFFSSWGAYSEATDNYNNAWDKLHKLQTLPLYPEQDNLKLLKAQEELADAGVVRLHEMLVPMAFPLVEMTPEQFQDKLSATVAALTKKAEEAGVILPAGQYLGFAEYQSSTPKPSAAAALGRQLKAIELVVSTLIDKRVVSIDRISRTPLPEEQAQPTPTPTPVPRATPRGGRQPAAKTAATPAPAAAPKVELLAKYPFDVQFTGDQTSFRTALNVLSKNSEQFFIIRPLSIRNQMERSPRKVDSEPVPGEERPVVTAVKDAVRAVEQMNYVFGAEKLNVTLRIDAVVFNAELPK